MARKGENIRKRADGRWEGRYIKGYTAGRGVYRSVYGKSYSEVKSKLRQAPPLDLKTDASYTCSQKTKFAEAAAAWLNSRGQTIKNTTLLCYQRLLHTHILPHIGENKLTAVTTKRLSLFLLEKLTDGRVDGKGGLSHSTVRSLRFIIGSVLKFAVREGLLSLAPIMPECMRGEKYQARLLTQEEQNRLQSFLSAHQTSESMGITLCLYGGLRLGEVCALQWEQVDFLSGSLRVEQTLQRSQLVDKMKSVKTTLTLTPPKSAASRRIIPLPKAILEQLKKWHKLHGGHGFVLGGRQPMEPRTFQNRFKNCLKMAGLDTANVHALRHTYATRCIEAGLDPKTVSELLGHSSVKLTLDRYVHPSLAQKQAQVQRLEIFIA